MLMNLELKEIGMYADTRKMTTMLVIFAFVSLVFIPRFGISAGFGGYPKRATINMRPGENGGFEILFFSRSEDNIKFYLFMSDYPEEFFITYPKSFNLESEFLGDEYVLIGGEYVKAKVVTVLVSVPDDTEPGEYRILLNVKSAGEEVEGTFLNVNAEKTFLLKVKVGEISKLEGAGATKSGNGEIESEVNVPKTEETYDGDLVGADEIHNSLNESSSNEAGKTGNPITGLLSYITENSLITLTVISLLSVSLIYLIYKKFFGSKSTVYATEARIYLIA